MAGQSIVHCAACSDEFRVKDVGLDRRRPPLPGQSLVVCFGLSFVDNSASTRPRRTAPTEIYQLCCDAEVGECNSPWGRLMWPKHARLLGVQISPRGSPVCVASGEDLILLRHPRVGLMRAHWLVAIAVPGIVTSSEKT